MAGATSQSCKVTRMIRNVHDQSESFRTRPAAVVENVLHPVEFKTISQPRILDAWHNDAIPAASLSPEIFGHFRLSVWPSRVPVRILTSDLPHRNQRNQEIAGWRSPWEGETSLHHPNFPSLSASVLKQVFSSSEISEIKPTRSEIIAGHWRSPKGETFVSILYCLRLKENCTPNHRSPTSKEAPRAKNSSQYCLWKIPPSYFPSHTTFNVRLFPIKTAAKSFLLGTMLTLTERIFTLRAWHWQPPSFFERNESPSALLHGSAFSLCAYLKRQAIYTLRH